MEKSNFDQLLQRYLTGKVSEKEKIKIEMWLDLFKADDVTSLEMSKEDEERVFQRVTGAIQEKEQLTKPSVPAKQISLFQWAMGMAAVLMLAVSYFMWMSQAGSGNIEKMILRDGTIVWLRGDESKINYFERPGEEVRYAELSGEALLEVSKDPRRPFLLKCGDVTVRVLGTSFRVKMLGDSLELEVLTGRVNLSSPGDTSGINVDPHQKIVYNGRVATEKVSLNAAEVSTIIKGTEYDMQFMNVTLDKVLDKIEKKFEVEIRVENNVINNCRITADFTDRSLESTFQMISEVLDFKYSINGSTVTVKGDGCE